MLIQAVESYLAVRRAAGFELKSEGNLLRSFARFSDASGKHYVCAKTAIEWAGSARSVSRRANRLGEVIRFARYIRAEDLRHELPPPVFGKASRPRPVPYIFSRDDIRRLVQAASELGRRNTFRGHTYSTFFALLACTGLRVSEAIHLRLQDIASDGLVIRCSKFRKSRLVPLHETAQAGLERYLQRRLMTPLAPHITAFLLQRLPIERGASPHTCDSYADAFRLLLEYVSNCLKIPPSQLHLEHLEASLIVNFLGHLETTRGNGASSRNIRLAAIKSFMRYFSCSFWAQFFANVFVLAVLVLFVHADKMRRPSAEPSARLDCLSDRLIDVCEKRLGYRRTLTMVPLRQLCLTMDSDINARL